MSEKCLAGCCPHDGTAEDAECPPDLPRAALRERAAHLYACQMLSTYKIALVTGADRQRITRLLHEAGVAVKPSNAGRRPTRRTPEGDRLDALMASLYYRGIPVVLEPGPIWRRFAVPHRLTAGLVTDLYEGCGLSLKHIELLTGRPAAAARALLRACNIPLRPAGGRSPFMRRWRDTGRGTQRARTHRTHDAGNQSHLGTHTALDASLRRAVPEWGFMWPRGPADACT